MPKISDLLGFGSVKRVFWDNIAHGKTVDDFVGAVNPYNFFKDYVDALKGETPDSTNSAATVSSGININNDGSTNIDYSNVTDNNLLTILGGWLLGANPEVSRMWNTAEAQKERDWQTDMSNSAYQRSVADMQAAGINPILAYAQGGASSGSGAVASGTPSSSSSVGSIMQGINSLFKTVLSEDRLSDAQADKSALAALKYADSHSAVEARNRYLKYKTTVEQTNAAANANKSYSQARWYDRH